MVKKRVTFIFNSLTLIDEFQRQNSGQNASFNVIRQSLKTSELNEQEDRARTEIKKNSELFFSKINKIDGNDRYARFMCPFSLFI